MQSKVFEVRITIVRTTGTLMQIRNLVLVVSTIVKIVGFVRTRVITLWRGGFPLPQSWSWCVGFWKQSASLSRFRSCFGCWWRLHEVVVHGKDLCKHPCDRLCDVSHVWDYDRRTFVPRSLSRSCSPLCSFDPSYRGPRIHHADYPSFYDHPSGVSRHIWDVRTVVDRQSSDP